MVNICPAKFEDWMIPAGSETVLRYGVYTFDGEMTDTEAERIWTDFAMPPEVTVR